MFLFYDLCDNMLSANAMRRTFTFIFVDIRKPNVINLQTMYNIHQHTEE